ncbi:helix-turn-helix transcriptional regulator [Agathobaculum sp. NSJ-28]|uniref:Helix-turn-helix transcriptional regulator n=1 Tax=Agathobaculum faecis TaxID=2763013 RepID=A0A923RWS0_9FIRM|nr:helix-turn-helix transcriptional regulator [Agathobaculum faecis]
MFYDRFVELCSMHGVSPSKAAQESGINKSTVTYWKNHTESKPTGQLAEKLCSYFNVSMSELYGDTQKETPPLTAKDERDIARDLERIRQALESEDTIMFDGDPMSDEARDSIMNAIELGLKAAKIKNKEKYTPKKYRKG